MRYILKLTIFLLILLPSLAFGATYYVATDGNNGAAGTEGAPWLTLTYAESQLNAGDTVIVRGGTYAERLIVNTIGSSGNEITFQAYSGESPIIDGQNSLAPNNWAALVYITGSYIIIDGFEVKRSNGTGVMVEGDVISGGDYVTIKNCTIHEIYRNGIFFADSADHCTAENNIVYNVSRDYLSDSSLWEGAIANRSCTYTTVRGNIVYQNYGEGIMMDRRTSDGLVENNVVYENRAVEIYLNCTKRNIVRNNLVYGTTDTTYWRYSIAPSQGIVIQNEQSYSWSEGWDGEAQIYGNLVANCGKKSFAIWSSPYSGTFQNIKVYNNTFIEAYTTDSSQIAVSVQNSVSGFEFKNNIIQQTTGTIANVASSGATYDYNLWSKEPEADAKGTNDLPYAAPLTTKTSGWNSLTAGSLDGTEFTLQSTSTAIDAGTDLGATYDDALHPINTDFSTSPPTVETLDQDDYGAGWEIGAFVYASAPQNQRPNSVIDTPEGDLYFTSSPQTVSFTGTGTDPESDAMTYLWNFDGMATNSTSADPGNVEISGSIPSEKTVTFTVSDAGGADPTPATITVHWVETLTADPICKAHYKFNAGALTTDSSGNANTLTNDGADEVSGIIDGGADFVKANTDSMTIADGDLCSGFWGKSGEDNQSGTACLWYKPDGTATEPADAIFAKADAAADKYSYTLYHDNTDVFGIALGYDSGAEFDVLEHEGTITPNGSNWYHVAFSYNDIDNLATIRVFDVTADAILQSGEVDNATKTMNAGCMSITDADVYIGGRFETGTGITHHIDGVVDDIHWYNYVLNDDEMDAVRSNQYPLASIQTVFAQTNDGTYKTDDVINLIVRFNKAVTVTGTPQFVCETGTPDMTFTYASGSGSTDLVFTDTVLADMATADLAISSASIDLNGGTIVYGASPAIDAYLTFPTSGPVNGYHQDSVAETDELDENSAIIIDTSQPTVFSIAEISGGAGTYVTGDTFYIDITSNGDAWNIDGPWTNCVLTGSMFPSNVSLTYFSGAFTDTIRMKYTVQAGDRITEFVFPNDTSFTDGDSTLHDAGSNTAVLTLPEVDPGSIVIEGEMAVNVSAGETYTSIMNLLAIYDHLVPDDAITYSAATTETSFVAAGAGASGHPVVINGEGYTITYTNGATFGQDYYTLNRIKYGSEITISGNNVTANYGLITSGWIKTETGTGIVINNHTVVGDAVLDIDVSTAINNCIVKDCALASGQTLTPYNTLFYESEATIETDGGTVDDTGAATCTFSADPLFRDETNGNYYLQYVSPGYNGGKDMSLTEDLNGRTIIGTPDIGAYETHLRRGRHRLR